MKPVLSAFVMAALACFATTARADGGRPDQGYTNADIKGGYGCGVSGALTGAKTVGIAQFHPEGNGTFSASVFVVNIDGVGVCEYSLEKGTGTYDISPPPAPASRKPLIRSRVVSELPSRVLRSFCLCLFRAGDHSQHV